MSPQPAVPAGPAVHPQPAALGQREGLRADFLSPPDLIACGLRASDWEANTLHLVAGDASQNAPGDLGLGEISRGHWLGAAS